MKEFTISFSKTKNKFNMVVLAQSCVFFPLIINAFRANTIPQIFILALAMVMPFILKPTEILAYMVGFAMMGTGIQVAYIALSSFIVILLKTKMRIRNISFIAILLFVIYELAHTVFAPDDTLMEFLRYVSVYAMLFIGMFLEYDTNDKVSIVNSYIYGTVVSIIHIFVETFYAVNGNLMSFIDGSLRFGYAEQLGVDLTMAADPNLIGQSCSFVIVFCLSLIMLGYKNKLYYVALFVALLAGTLTISKTFLLSLILIVVFLILFVGSWTSRKAIAQRIFLISLVILGCFVVIKVNPAYIENILSRVDESDITTGRTANAMRYFDYLTNNAGQMIFGVGMQNVGPKIGFTGSPHAAIVEGLVCWGFVGFTVMVVLIIYAIFYQKKGSRTIMLNWVPFMVCSVIMQTTQLFRLRDRVFTLIVMIITVGISKKGEKINECQEESIVDNKL